MAKDINIGGRLHSIATGNVIAGADEILDDNLGKKQTQINTETYNLVESVNNALDALSPDQQEALGVAVKANANEAKLGYYVCDTDTDVTAKTIAATGYVLGTGGNIRIKMTNANTADAATLNINSTGAKALFYNGAQASSTNSWEAGEVVEVYYDGTRYQCGGRLVNVKAQYESDLDVTDENGNVLCRFQKGNIKTKNFDNTKEATTSERGMMSATDKTKLNGIEQGAEVNNTETRNAYPDFEIADENRNAILRILNGHIKTKNFDSEKIEKKISLLCIGNSYSRDSVYYVPIMLKQLGIECTIGILYHAGCSLQMHVENIGTEYYYYDEWNGNGWTISKDSQSTYNRTLEYGVKKRNWDFITFQQGSRSNGYSKIQNTWYGTGNVPYIDTLINQVYSYLLASDVFDGSVRFAWMNVAAMSDVDLDSLSNPWLDSDANYEDIVALGEFVLKTVPQVEFVIPVATFVQNAVHNATLSQYTGELDGDTSGRGGILHYNHHLLEGIGRQVADYAVLWYIFNESPMGNKTRFTSSTFVQYPLPEYHGSPIGSTDENSYIAQQCAIAAIKNPNEITEV